MGEKLYIAIVNSGGKNTAFNFPLYFLMFIKISFYPVYQIAVSWFGLTLISK